MPRCWGYVLGWTNSVDELTRSEFIISMYKLLYSDGFYGEATRPAADCHYKCAKIYAERGDEKKTREHLEGMARFAKQYETLPQEFTFKSPILKDLKRYRSGAPDKLTVFYLKCLTEERRDCKVFDRFREEGWFERIIEELESDK